MARMVSRRTSQAILVLLALFLLGTVAFLWAVNSYFSIDAAAIILPEELGTWEEIRLGAPESSLSGKARNRWAAKALSVKPNEAATLDAKSELELSNAIAKHAADAAKAAGFGTDVGAFVPTGRNNTPKAWNAATDPPEKIPRIIHQTWKEKTLPPEWQPVRDECAKMHPDYEYHLWTDADSRQFLVDNYAWFVPIFDAYPYPIQRADAIRYFILHHYGGIYMDLDVGCLRRFDPLLRFEVVLPKTIPVGVSNDVMAAAKGHPFMDHLIHNLVTFNHRYLTHYPTVMFSTGPMFVSASYGLYVDAHGPSKPSTPANPSAGFTGIRVLPKPLYGKNADPSEVPDAFFLHFYGSSWHAGDADFLIFLRAHGRLLIFVGVLVVVLGFGYSALPRIFGSLQGRRADGKRRRSTSRRGRWVSLPFVQDPHSGQYRSVPGDIFPGTSGASSSRSAARGRSHLLDESTQTSHSPVTVAGAADTRASPSSSRAASTTRVAAPRPQRLPLFQLREGEAIANSDDEVDLGPGLNAERMAREKVAGATSSSEGGIFGWMHGAYEGSIGSTDGGTGLMRSGSASKFKEKATSVLYLPAYLVGASSASSTDSSTTDSALASVRVGDDDESSPHSPDDRPSSRTGTPSMPPWSLTKAHSRSVSAQNGGLTNWAASFLGGSTSTNAGQSSGTTLSRAWSNVSLAGRTPSPGLFLGHALRPPRPEENGDLERGGLGSSKEKADTDMAGEVQPIAETSSSATQLLGQTSPAATSRRRGSFNYFTESIDRRGGAPSGDATDAQGPSLPLEGIEVVASGDSGVPPPPYDYDGAPASGTFAAESASAWQESNGNLGGDVDDTTPTLGAKRIIGKQS